MNIKQTVKELQWKANQLAAEAEKHREAARVLEALDQTTAVQAVAALNPQPPKGKRTMSAAARKRIAAAQRARWAKWHKARKAGKVVQFRRAA